MTPGTTSGRTLRAAQRRIALVVPAAPPPATVLDGHAYVARRADGASPRVEAFLKRIGAAP